MVRSVPFLCLLAALSPMLCWAQNGQDAATRPANAAPSQASPNDTPSTTVGTDKSKKVWTNEDLKSAGSVSVIGDPRNQKYTMTKPPDPGLVTKYKTSLQKLQTQLADVNKQLVSYHDFAEGKSVSDEGRDMSHGVSRTPVDQQIVKLQDKKKQLEDQIDALYEEARKKGIESGMLK